MSLKAAQCATNLKQCGFSYIEASRAEIIYVIAALITKILLIVMEKNKDSCSTNGLKNITD